MIARVTSWWWNRVSLVEVPITRRVQRSKHEERLVDAIGCEARRHDDVVKYATTCVRGVDLALRFRIEAPVVGAHQSSIAHAKCFDAHVIGRSIEIAEHRDIRVCVREQHVRNKLLRLQCLKLALMRERNTARFEMHDEHGEFVSILGLEIHAKWRALESFRQRLLRRRPRASQRSCRGVTAAHFHIADCCVRARAIRNTHNRNAREHALFDASVVRRIHARHMVISHAFEIGVAKPHQTLLRLDFFEAKHIGVQCTNHFCNPFEARRRSRLFDVVELSREIRIVDGIKQILNVVSGKTKRARSLFRRVGRAVPNARSTDFLLCRSGLRGVLCVCKHAAATHENNGNT